MNCVAELRDYYGLEKRPVKVHEPYQMLGLMEEDLQQAMGLDVEGVFPRKTMFGFPSEHWKPWSLNGLEVLVPEKFNVTEDENGDTLIYPEGDLGAEPSARMPKGFHFFDAIIRQNHFDEQHLNPADNLEEFTSLMDYDLAAIAADVREAAGKGRAVIANFGGTAFGDIALVPAPFLKDPRGIRDITEWYVSTRSRRGYIHQIFSRQCDIALDNLARIHSLIGDSSSEPGGIVSYSKQVTAQSDSHQLTVIYFGACAFPHFCPKAGPLRHWQQPYPDRNRVWPRRGVPAAPVPGKRRRIPTIGAFGPVAEPCSHPGADLRVREAARYSAGMQRCRIL